MLFRSLVSAEIWAGHYGAPLDEREIARHYTLTGDDLEIVGRRRGDATRLGYAMLLLYMRWPGSWCWRRRSAEHPSELQSLMRISYAVFCLKKKQQQPHRLYRVLI